MEFLLFLLFVCLNLIFLGGVSYYARLFFFQKKFEYNREEIISIGRAIPMEILKVLESGNNLLLGVLFLFGGALLSGLWARLGGLVGSAHYTHSWGNYFFHLPLFFVVFGLGYGFFKDSFGRNPTGYGKIFWDHSQPFAIGLGVGALSKSLSSYGGYHEMYFAFSLLNLIIIVYLSAYIWNGERILGLVTPGKKNGMREDDYSNDFDANDYSSEDFNHGETETSSDLGDLDMDSSLEEIKQKEFGNWEEN